MKLTKMTKAKVIVQALWGSNKDGLGWRHMEIDQYENWPEPRKRDVRKYSRMPMNALDDQYDRAVILINQRLKEGVQ